MFSRSIEAGLASRPTRSTGDRPPSPPSPSWAKPTKVRVSIRGHDHAGFRSTDDVEPFKFGQPDPTLETVTDFFSTDDEDVGPPRVHLATVSQRLGDIVSPNATPTNAFQRMIGETGSCEKGSIFGLDHGFSS